MYSVSSLAKTFGVARNTIKNWSIEFADFLSPQANARPRSFVEADLTVLTLVSTLRQQGVSYSDIHEALESGERMMPPAAADYTDKQSTGLFAKLTSTLARHEGQLTEVRKERDNLREDLRQEQENHNETRERLFGTLARAVRAEVERDAYRAQLEEFAELGLDGDDERPKPWWQRLFGRDE